MKGRRILVLAPHPDDEVVGAAAAIARAKAEGSTVFVLYLTTGVPAAESWSWAWRGGYQRRVARRRAEAVTVAAALGFEPAGFADRPSGCLAYDLLAARAVVVEAIAQLKADCLWVPVYEGGHQDHDAANALSASLTDGIEVWEFAEYCYAGEKVTANAFLSRHEGERAIALSADEQARKRYLLTLYSSVRHRLGHIGTGRESFRPLSRIDYSRPPHAGALFYQKFRGRRLFGLLRSQPGSFDQAGSFDQVSAAISGFRDRVRGTGAGA